MPHALVETGLAAPDRDGSRPARITYGMAISGRLFVAVAGDSPDLPKSSCGELSIRHYGFHAAIS
jgi:hypothetical protein